MTVRRIRTEMHSSCSLNTHRIGKPIRSGHARKPSARNKFDRLQVFIQLAQQLLTDRLKNTVGWQIKHPSENWVIGVDGGKLG
jgi:hypothetical protein